MRVIEARGLSEIPIDAATVFFGDTAVEVRLAVAGGVREVCIAFDPAGHMHSAWRRAAIQELAREAAPARVNAIAGDDEGAVAAAVAYLSRAPGVSGQYLQLDGNGAGNPAR